MRALILVLLLAGVAHADRRVLWVHNEHSNEVVRLRPFGLHGLVDRLAWARLTRHWRSWRTQQRRHQSQH